MASWPIWLRVAMGKHLVDGIRADASLAGNLCDASRLSPESDVRSSTIHPRRDTYGGNLPECMSAALSNSVQPTTPKGRSLFGQLEG